MGVKTKIRTAVKVIETFGLFELVRLAGRKFGFSKAGLVEVHRPHGVDIKTVAQLTNEFYSSVLSTTTADVIKAREEYEEYQNRFMKRVASPRSAFFTPVFDLGLGMSEFIFLCVLIKKPQIVIETGVAAGISTNSILAALHLNGAGSLLSIDITNKVGELVDDKFKSAWKLEILSELARENSFANYLKANNGASVFLHDSDHSGSWQIKEFSNVVRFLPSLELILFDDISQKLIDFIKENYPEFQIIVIDEKRKYSAVILKSEI
jgi:predicted O-methyltransferase YrrM